MRRYLYLLSSFYIGISIKLRWGSYYDKGGFAETNWHKFLWKMMCVSFTFSYKHNGHTISANLLLLAQFINGEEHWIVDKERGDSSTHQYPKVRRYYWTTNNSMPSIIDTTSSSSPSPQCRDNSKSNSYTTYHLRLKCTFYLSPAYKSTVLHINIISCLIIIQKVCIYASSY